MITDILLTIATGIVFALANIFSAISLAIPTQIQSAILYFTGYLNYFRGVFPVDSFIQVCSFLLLFWSTVYLFKVVLFGYSLMPWVGRNPE